MNYIHRDIIVIGASAGGFEAIQTLVAGLPADFKASIFIVWHMSPDTTGILPFVLNKQSKCPAFNARNNEPILPGHIYVAPPDHHLLLENGYTRLTRGPKENRFRPAVDPLFRSAASIYGPRVIGIILSGALDDGTSGLWSIKQAGGLAVVQEPSDAAVPSMPENALHSVAVDYCVPVADMAALLVRLCNEEINQIPGNMKRNEQTETELAVAAEDNQAALQLFRQGKLTPYTCPECNGVLAQLGDGDRPRFRCHTGHAFSPDVLLAAISQHIEDSYYKVMRGLDESVMLLNHLGDHFAAANDPKLAAVYFKKAKEAGKRTDVLRAALNSYEHLSQENMSREALDEDEKQDNRP